MGQRLNLEIRDGDKVLANAYYHWSAYTKESYTLTKECYDYIKSHPNKDHRLLAIKALEFTGAGVVPDDLDYLKSLDEYKSVEFVKAHDRNSGLIGVLPSSIEETQYWAEGTSIIDISTGKINFFVFFDYSKKDLDDYVEVQGIKDLKYDLTSLTIKQLGKVIDLVCDCDYVFKIAEDTFISEIA